MRSHINSNSPLRRGTRQTIRRPEQAGVTQCPYSFAHAFQRNWEQGGFAIGYLQYYTWSRCETSNGKSQPGGSTFNLLLRRRDVTCVSCQNRYASGLQQRLNPSSKISACQLPKFPQKGRVACTKAEDSTETAHRWGKL